MLLCFEERKAETSLTDFKKLSSKIPCPVLYSGDGSDLESLWLLKLWVYEQIQAWGWNWNVIWKIW